MHSRINAGSGIDLAAYEGAKTRLRECLESRPCNVVFLARVRDLEEGEKPTSYFFQAMKVGRSAEMIPGLRGAGGLVTGVQQMLGIAEAYYTDLFSMRPCDLEAQEACLSFLEARLSEEEVRGLEAPLTSEEVLGALSSMRDERAPGSDGLPKELYRGFWDVLGQDLVDVHRAILERGALSPSMRKGTVALLFKAGERCELNWRPLTLLNCDYKVLSKVATVRLKKVMASIVSPDQVCGVPGCSISWNLMAVRDVLDWVKDRRMPLALV